MTIAKEKFDVRWMLRKDMPEVVNIEELCFECPWPEEQFISVLRRPSVIGKAALCGGHVVGFMVYELYKTRVHLLSIAVHPNCWRQGVGAMLIRDLLGNLRVDRRNRVMTEVRECNLPAQLFMKAQGFRATNVLYQFYDDCDEAAYVFLYRIRQEDTEAVLT